MFTSGEVRSFDPPISAEVWLRESEERLFSIVFFPVLVGKERLVACRFLPDEG